jgi:protein gp37
MGEQSVIEWTDSTWNPWRGCDKVSEGCDECYTATARQIVRELKSGVAG